MSNKTVIFAIDFDGVLCKDEYPSIGAPNTKMIQFIKDLQEASALSKIICPDEPFIVKFILWTCREGKTLYEAVEWCKNQQLCFDAINDNIPENIALYGENNRKVYADYYIDDHAIHPYDLFESDDIIDKARALVESFNRRLSEYE